MTDIIIPKKNIILDATMLTNLMGCARQYDFRMNHDLQAISGKSPSIEMGSVVHIINEHFYKNMRAGDIRYDAINKALSRGREYVRDETKNITDEDTQLIFNTMDEYFDFYKNDSWIPIDVEYVKKELIYEDDECRIMWAAKLDLTVDTNNGIYPVDHKTMKQRRDSSSLNNQFMGQCILMKTRGLIINKIGFQKSLKSHEKFTRPIISYSADRLIEWSQIIVPFWAKQLLAYDQIGFWPPNFTHCENKFGFCAFKEVCESDSSMREENIRLNFIRGDKWNITNEND